MLTSGREATVYVLNIDLPFLRVRFLCESCEAFSEILPPCLRIAGLAVVILGNGPEALGEELEVASYDDNVPGRSS